MVLRRANSRSISTDTGHLARHLLYSTTTPAHQHITMSSQAVNWNQIFKRYVVGVTRERLGGRGAREGTVWLAANDHA